MSQIASGSNRYVVDWDGTCVEAVYPNQGDWLPGAVDALKLFLASGIEVVIFSTRLAPTELDEKTLLPQEDVNREYDYIRGMLDAAGLQKVLIWDKYWKPGAKVYIDDKGVRFHNWGQVLDDLEGLFPPTQGMMI